MAKIYVSYSHADKELVYELTNQLRKRGHELLMDVEVMKVGLDFRKTLLSALKNADGVLVFITENSLNSKYVISEIGAARAFVDETSNKKFLIPVLYGDVEIPNIIQDLYCVRLSSNNYDDALNLIDQSISSFFGRREAVEDKENKERQKIEKKASDYIQVAITALQERENRNSCWGGVLVCNWFFDFMLRSWFCNFRNAELKSFAQSKLLALCSCDIKEHNNSWPFDCLFQICIQPWQNFYERSIKKRRQNSCHFIWQILSPSFW
jgi:hypothetical protein